MKTALLKLHLSVLLAGFTGVFGKLIDLHEAPLVWWRLFLVVIIMYPMLRLRGRFKTYPPRTLAVMTGIGGLQTLHWVLFYASIQLSTVSVGLVCISLMGFFTAILSPLILRTRWSAREFLYSGITIAGIALIFHFDTQYRLGIAIGVVSSAIAALFVICNKRFAHDYEPDLLFFYEIAGGLVLLTLFMPAYLAFRPEDLTLPGARDFFNLFLLSFFCTVILYVIQLQALRKVSAFTVNLSLNLEPVYAVILAGIFLGEAKDFTSSFYMGMGLIILSVTLQTAHVLLRERRTRRMERTLEAGV